MYWNDTACPGVARSGTLVHNLARLRLKLRRGSLRSFVALQRKNSYSQVPVGKSVARTTFEVTFELLGSFKRLEGSVKLQLPLPELCRMQAAAAVVVRQPLPQV